MRPVDKGIAPTTYSAYENARPDLASHLGMYCSYCERKLPTHLAVEHIIAKHNDPSLELHWNNFLLSCVNCNSAKSTKTISLDKLYFPDRDNTFVAFEYNLSDGSVVPSSSLTSAQAITAKETLELTGLSKPMEEIPDKNGILVYFDRVGQRKEAGALAKRWHTKLSDIRAPMLIDAIVDLALRSGFFSIWMTVFEGDAEMRNRFIAEFKGTAKDCFDPITTAPISPRPTQEHLAHSGKI